MHPKKQDPYYNTTTTNNQTQTHNHSYHKNYVQSHTGKK